MNIEKLKEVFSDEAFAKSLFELDSAVEVQAALKEKSAELTEEEILAICEFFAKVKSGEISLNRLSKSQSGELSEEALEQVAGGGFWGSVWDFLCDWLGHLGGC